MTPEELVALLRAVAQRDLLLQQNAAMRAEIERLQQEGSPVEAAAANTVSDEERGAP